MITALPKRWCVGCLADVVDNIAAGTSVNCDDREFEDGDKRVLKLSAVSAGHFNPKEYKIVSRAEHSRLRTSVRKGTVLFTRKNTPDLVGDSAYIDDVVCELYLPDLIWELTTVNSIDPRWLNYWLQAPAFRRQVQRLSVGSSKSMVGLSQDSILDSYVFIPPHIDQQRIVAVLDTWDKVISLTTLLSDAKRQRYCGLLNRLIGPAFVDAKSNHWTPRKLGQVFFERDERSADLPLLSITGERGVVPRDDLDRRQTASEDKSKYKVIRPGDIGFNTMRMWQGVFGRSEHTGIVSPAYTVVTAVDGAIDPVFASHLFAHPRAINLFHRYSQGLVDDTLMLKFPQFSEITMRLPDIHEQLEIGRMLEAEEYSLRPQESLLELLRQQKSGLMQKLLTGEWTLDERFNPPTTESRLALAGGVA
jgi:type I restriction enzyme S subunit